MGHNYVIIDTGFWIALADKKDAFHSRAINALDTIQHRRWITTWPTLTEASHYFIQWNSKEFLRWFQNLSMDICEIFPLNESHLSRLNQLVNKYVELPMDLADASLVLLAEEIDNGDIVSTDLRDFQTYRWKNRHPFSNLL